MPAQEIRGGGMEAWLARGKQAGGRSGVRAGQADGTRLMYAGSRRRPEVPPFVALGYAVSNTADVGLGYAVSNTLDARGSTRRSITARRVPVHFQNAQRGGCLYTRSGLNTMFQGGGGFNRAGIINQSRSGVSVRR